MRAFLHYDSLGKYSRRITSNDDLAANSPLAADGLPRTVLVVEPAFNPETQELVLQTGPGVRGFAAVAKTPNPVPVAISKRALLNFMQFDRNIVDPEAQVQTAINAQSIPQARKTFLLVDFSRTTIIKRADDVVRAIARHLKLTDAQIDQMFIGALAKYD